MGACSHIDRVTILGRGGGYLRCLDCGEMLYEQEEHMTDKKKTEKTEKKSDRPDWANESWILVRHHFAPIYLNPFSGIFITSYKEYGQIQEKTLEEVVAKIDRLVKREESRPPKRKVKLPIYNSGGELTNLTGFRLDNRKPLVTPSVHRLDKYDTVVYAANKETEKLMAEMKVLSKQMEELDNKLSKYGLRLDTGGYGSIDPDHYDELLSKIEARWKNANEGKGSKY